MAQQLDFEITIDESNSIRILSAENHQNSDKLKTECNKFLSSLLLNRDCGV